MHVCCLNTPGSEGAEAGGDAAFESEERTELASNGEEGDATDVGKAVSIGQEWPSRCTGRLQSTQHSRPSCHIAVQIDIVFSCA